MSQPYLPPGQHPSYPPHQAPYHGAQYQAQYPAQYPAPYAATVAPQASNGLATGGFVVALCGAVLSIIPFLGIVAWIVAPVGLILSIIGLTRSAQQGGRGLAISGVVLGAAALFICLLWVIGLAGASSTSGSTYSTSGYSYSAPR
ncbi:hypothetical protein Acsp06_64680 [Actinomycetospora sp. NBRC 106375]|uniref:hypothetical protein n=1 Tax=Actinomycetospora sp. NBRC 106375 TaxID=3032207 RepID=UPI0024A15046|nr:hypothetical protein [Actinomycetospora sp. NBRC 106375]GLZ50283.1 hypothetical protein Acsp06_64680 [Actinomycetospora sp. NBRC 106375]